MNASARWLNAEKPSPGLAVGAGAVVLSYGLAFVQRPGRTFADTRIEMATDPARFLHSLTSVWSSTGDLGHVHSAQFVGYLVPMAPWYAFAHTIGLSTWVAQRIWLGTLLAAAGLGVIVLLRELLGRSAPLAQAVAATLFLANPYVVVVIGRTSVWLLPYASLPWLLLAVHRGIRNPRGWRWPAIFALILCLGNGGTNATLTFWIVLPPPALLVYEVLVLRSVTWRGAGAFAVRTALCSAIAALWWVIPVILQPLYGPNFLSFSEQPSGIFATPSVSESLRLLGYWLVYFGSPTAPSVGPAGTYLFNPWVIVATFAVPLAAVAGFLRARRWAYAPFFMLLLVCAVVAMSLGFPPGSPLNRVLVAAYYHSNIVQVLRTGFKAAPLLALPYACLAGLWAESVLSCARAGRLRAWRLRLPAWSVLALVPVPVLWALPLFNGTTIDKGAAYKSVPTYWRAALHDATAATDANQRIMIIPGELFGAYRWGQTGDSVAPNLTPRRLTIREINRWSDPRSSQLQVAIDDLVQQNRLVPGQLEPLLQLLGVGSVLVPTDGDLPLDGALDPADVASALRDQSFAHAAVHDYGRTAMYAPEPGRGGPAVALPDIRRYALPTSGPGVVRVHPVADTTVLDGDGYGITELAADGALDPAHALVYAGDTSTSTLSELVHTGARLVFSDSSRRRVVAPSSIAQDVGPTLESGDPIAGDTPTYQLFPARGVAAETVATYNGLAYLRTPAPHRAGPIFPEDGPYGAFDGRPDTAWLADPLAAPNERYLQLELSSPRPIASISIYPLSDPPAITFGVAISINGAAERQFPLKAGWNKIPINAASLRTLRIRVTSAIGSAGGISEIRIPGLHPTEALRLPTDLAAATSRLNLAHNDIAIALARTTADFPYRENTDVGGLPGLNPVYAADAERDIRRIVTLPAARSFTLAGWASVRAAAPDPLIDQLAGMPRAWTFSSSDRFEGVPIDRASSAFDGNPKTAWIATFVAGRHLPWIQFSWPRPLSFRTLRLTAGASEYEFPSQVRLSVPHRPSENVLVGPNGEVALPHAVRTRAMRLQVLSVRLPRGRAAFDRLLNAVAIEEIRVPGLRPPIVSRGRFATRCGELSVSADSATARAVVYGTVTALDQGEPLAMRGCGRHARLPLKAGATLLEAPAGSVMQPDHLFLDSPAPEPLVATTTAVLRSPGTATNGVQDRVLPDVSGPSWLVLGESYSSGWQAWCRGAAGHEYALGASQPIDGYANGWRIDSSCVSARMAFAPQGIANAGYVLSAIGAGLMLLVAVGLTPPVRIRRRLRTLPWPRPAAAPATAPSPASGTSSAPAAAAAVVPQALAPIEPGSIRLPPAAAIAWGLGVGVITGFVFSLRFGAAAGPLTVVLLALVGVSVRRLIALAAVGIVAIPILYVARPAHNYGGYSFYFSLHQIVAHWIGVGAVCALFAAGLLQAIRMRARTQAPSGAVNTRRDTVP